MSDEPVIGVNDYREALRRLLIGWRTHATNGLDIKQDRIRVVTLVYPWVAQTHRFGRAYVHLEKQGYAHEGHGLVRSALEYALLSHWVAVTGDAGVVSRYAEDHRQLRALRDEATRQNPRDVRANPWNLDLLEELVEEREKDQQPVGADEDRVARKIDQICDRLGIKNTVYPAYRVHSWFAHPTTHTTAMYMVMQDDGTVALREQPDIPSADATLSMMAHCVFWARRVLDDLTVGRPYENWLDEISASIHVMPRLPQPSPADGETRI